MTPAPEGLEFLVSLALRLGPERQGTACLLPLAVEKKEEST